MQQLKNIHSGNLSEDYAKVILGKIAITTPVPRQNDFQGIDFHCSLLREVGQNLQPFAPFNVQIKSASEDSVSYGGETESGNWRRHEVEALHRMQTPFFIGSVDKDDQRLDLYQTISRAFLWGKKSPFQAKLILDQPSWGEGSKHAIDGLSETDEYEGVCWDIPVGLPVLSLQISDLKDEEKVNQATEVLLSYINLDQENIVLTRAGLAHFRWPIVSQKGVSVREYGIVISAQDPPTRILKVLSPAVAGLLDSYKLQGKKELILPWTGVIDQLPTTDFGIVGAVIDQAVNFAQTKDQGSDDEQEPQQDEAEDTTGDGKKVS